MPESSLSQTGAQTYSVATGHFSEGNRRFVVALCQLHNDRQFLDGKSRSRHNARRTASCPSINSSQQLKETRGIRPIFIQSSAQKVLRREHHCFLSDRSGAIDEPRRTPVRRFPGPIADVENFCESYPQPQCDRKDAPLIVKCARQYPQDGDSRP